MSFLCVRRCPHITIRADQYLAHLAECEKVAPWISAWAKRVVAREDWRAVVGLRG